MHLSATQLTLDDFLAVELRSSARRPVQFPRMDQPSSRLHRRLLYRYQLHLKAKPSA